MYVIIEMLINGCLYYTYREATENEIISGKAKTYEQIIEILRS